MSQTDGMLYFSTLTAIYKKPSSWNDLTGLVAGDLDGDVDGALDVDGDVDVKLLEMWMEP